MKINSKDIWQRKTIFIMCSFAYLLVTLLFSIFYINMAETLAMFVGFLLFLTGLYLLNKNFFILSFVFIYGQIGVILSIFLIENGFFIHELNIYGSFIGANSLLIVFNLIFFASAYLCFIRVRSTNTIDYSPRASLILNIIILAIYLFAIVYALITHTSPIITKVNHIQYFYDLPYWCRTITGQFSLIAFMSGYNYAKLPSKTISSKFQLIVVIIVLFTQVLLGNKFTNLFFTVISFLVPYCIIKFEHNDIDSFQIKRIILFILLFMTFSATMLFLYYYYHGHHSSLEHAVNRIIARIAEQGEVWWGTLLHYNNHGILKSTSFNINDYSLYKLMYLIAPHVLVTSYKTSHVTFTMGFPAILLLHFKVIDVALFLVVLGGVLGACIAFFNNAIVQSRFFLSILYFKLYIHLIQIFQMGKLNNIVSARMIVIVLLILLFSIFYYLMDKNYMKIFRKLYT